MSIAIIITSIILVTTLVLLPFILIQMFKLGSLYDEETEILFMKEKYEKIIDNFFNKKEEK